MSAETHVHNKDGELARSVCGQCNDAYFECTVCEVYFCDCSRATEGAQAAENVALTDAERIIAEAMADRVTWDDGAEYISIKDAARIVAEAVERERAAWAAKVEDVEEVALYHQRLHSQTFRQSHALTKALATLRTQIEGLALLWQSMADGAASSAAAREGLSDVAALKDYSAVMTRRAGDLRAILDTEAKP